MANLENLNFEVILKDDTFKKQIAQVQAMADKFNISMSAALSLSGVKGGAANVREVVKALNEATAAQKNLNAAIKASPAEKITIRHRYAVAATNQKMVDTARLLRTIGTLTGGAFSIYGIRRFLSSLIEITGQFEVQKMALRTMLQDIDAADKIFQDLYRFSSDSTYRFSELAKYSKQLAAFNIGKDNLLETTKMLGDVASGVGVSMDRLILAYGHVKSSGFLRGIQLRSFSQNGVPILDELAKMFTEIEGKAVSLGEVFDKMTRREIPFEMVEQAFKNMTSEGGKFYQMQEVLSKTLAGQMNILKGRWENLMYAVGQSQEGVLKGAVSSISNLIANYDEVGRLLKQIIVTFSIYKATLLGVELVTNTLTLTNHRLLRSLANIGKWIVSNPYATLAAGIAAVAIVALRLGNEMDDISKITKALNDATTRYNNSLDSEIGELDALYGRLKNAREGTDEYAAAKLAIQKRFGSYITELDNEGVAVGNLANIYQNLADKIKNANKQRFLEESQQDIINAYNIAQGNAEGRLKAVLSQIKTTGGRGLTADEEGAIRHYVNTGEKNTLFKSIEESLNNRMMTAVAGQHGIEYRRNGKTFRDELTDIRNDVDLASITYADAMTDAAKRFDAVNKEIVSNAPQMEYKLSSIVEGIKKVDAEIAQLRGKARGGSITQDEKDRLDALVKEREEAAKEYKDIMGVDYDKDTRASAKAVESANKEELRSLQKRVSVIQKYKEVYDTLRPFLGEENMASALGSIFGVKFEDTDFDTELDRLIVKLSELGEEGEQAAESLRASLGKDTASQLKKSLEAQDKAADMLRDYLEKDFGVEGTGVAAQISKLLVDLTNKNLKADDGLEKYIQSLDKADLAKKLELLSEHSGEFAAMRGLGFFDDKEQDDLVDAYWQKWRKAQIDAYKEQLKLEKQANEKLTGEQIVGKADDIFKMLTGGIDLTNWNDKTIGQLRQIRAELLSLEIPQEILDMLDPETQARLQKAFDAIRGGEITKSDKVVSEKNVKAAQKLLNAFQGIGTAITEMGDAMGNDVLSGVGQILSMAEEITSVLAENESLMKSISGVADDVEEGTSDIAKSADWITMIIKLVLIFIKQFASVAGEAREEMLALEESAREARDIMFDKNLADGADSIFGKNFVKQINNASAALKQLRLDMGLAAGQGMSGIGIKTLTKKGGWFGLGKTNFSLQDAASELGMSLLDDYGILNVELLKLIQDTYTLDDISAKWIADAIQESEHYIEAMEEIEDVMSNVFGDIASSAADSIVDEWVAAGDAALDYANILDDVAKSYSKMLIQSAILDEILNEDEIKRVMAMFVGGNYEGAMAAIAGDMEHIAAMEPVFQSILEAFDPYFNKSSESTLANGIKGITEDTANLLTSYLNAIRADVSFLRAMAQQGWANVESITASLAVLPSLADYMMRIEAHNANTAENTQQILSELRGVIINEGSGRGFRSYPA